MLTQGQLGLRKGQCLSIAPSYHWLYAILPRQGNAPKLLRWNSIVKTFGFTYTVFGVFGNRGEHGGVIGGVVQTPQNKDLGIPFLK